MQILIQPQKEQRMEFAISLAAVLKYILIFFLKATNRIEHFATDILFFFFFLVRLLIFYFKRLIFLDVSTMVCLIFGCLQSNNF